VLLAGSVLTSDVGRTVCAELDAGDERHCECEESRVSVSASDPANNDTQTDGRYLLVGEVCFNC